MSFKAGWRLRQALAPDTIGLKKTNYLIIVEPTSNQPTIVREKLGKGAVTKVDYYKYFGLYIDLKGNLDLHIQKLKTEV